ncbi:MAG: gamma subclass chorismate mutase AroQ [Methylovulum sp.]|nr:gamma subclass chorismate mutase AroQ [Methylovulum sp.]
MKLALIPLIASTLASVHPVAVPANTPVHQALSCSTQPVGRILSLMDYRLKLATDVARYKWNTQGKIEDLAREQAIIASLGQQAVQQGLPVTWAERFFRAQIDASKQIQKALFSHWRQIQSGQFDNVPDLPTVTRPKLDTLTMQLINALADAWPQLQNPACKSKIGQLVGAKLKEPDYNTTTIATATDPLLQPINP